MKREREADARVGEESPEFGIDRAPRPQHREYLHEVPTEQVAPAEERAFQNRSEPFELRAVLVQVSGEVRGIGGADARNLLLHASDIGRAIQLASRAEQDSILWIETHHRNFRVQVAADELEDAFQNLRIEEEGGPEVEAEGVGFEGTTSASDARKAFHHVDVQARVGEQQCRREATGASPDDEYLATAARFRGLARCTGGTRQ